MAPSSVLSTREYKTTVYTGIIAIYGACFLLMMTRGHPKLSQDQGIETKTFFP